MQGRISLPGSKVSVWVVAVEEEPLMVREALSVLGGGARTQPVE